MNEPMNKPWLYLQKRYSESIATPNDSDLAAAANELFDETLPMMTEADYSEHGTAHLRLGYDSGPMYVIEVTRLGEAIFEEWADQDYENEICPPRSLRVTKQEAITLWKMLKENRIEDLRRAFA